MGDCVVTIACMNSFRDANEVQSNFDGDTICNRGTGRGFGTWNTSGLAIRKSFPWFLDSISQNCISCYMRGGNFDVVNNYVDVNNHKYLNKCITISSLEKSMV